jgi:hypothetical protein
VSTSSSLTSQCSFEVWWGGLQAQKFLLLVNWLWGKIEIDGLGKESSLRWWACWTSWVRCTPGDTSIVRAATSALVCHYMVHNFICSTTIIAQYPYLADIKQELNFHGDGSHSPWNNQWSCNSSLKTKLQFLLIHTKSVHSKWKEQTQMDELCMPTYKVDLYWELLKCIPACYCGTQASELMLSLGLSAPKHWTCHRQTWSISGSSIYNHIVHMRTSLSETHYRSPWVHNYCKQRSTICCRIFKYWGLITYFWDASHA